MLQPAGYIGNLGRNTLIGPGLFTLDVVVERSIRLGAGGDRALQLRLEAFNLTNRVNLALPSSVSLFDARGNYLEDAGRITGTSTSARQVQLGVKVVW